MRLDITLIVMTIVTRSLLSQSSSFTRKHLHSLKLRTKDLFNHAWDSYLDYGFPADEVRPLTCTPHEKDTKDPLNLVRNDVMGNFSLTVFDNLDTFIMLNEPKIFIKLIYWIRDTYPDFNIDSNVQVFETNIRILGGLLSAHLYASDLRQGFAVDGYDGFLLKLAHDLGDRLILAFDTPTSIPFPRTNLAKGPRGTPRQIQVETCTAGAGSPVLEFTLLSRLSGDPKFETLSKKLFMTLWGSRTLLDLLPMTIDPYAGKWLDSVTGIGASVDSFYEYALKMAILFDDDEYLDIWSEGYSALNTHLKSEWVYENVDPRNGQVFTTWIDSLSAFWPGLQVLAGDVSNAIKLHSLTLKIWETFNAIPERWNTEILSQESRQILERTPKDKHNEMLVNREIVLEWYPLRPEFIESTYHLYRATKDPVFLQIGKDFLNKLETKYKAPCGFAGMLDVRSNKRQDRMESFVLSETLKYLYLLFDEDNPVHNKINGNLIFSTELHPFWFDEKLKPESTGFNWFVNSKPYEFYGSINETQALKYSLSDLWKSPQLIKEWWYAKSDTVESSFVPQNIQEDLTSKMKKSFKSSFDDIERHGLVLQENKVKVGELFRQFYQAHFDSDEPLRMEQVDSVFDELSNIAGKEDVTPELQAAMISIVDVAKRNFYDTGLNNINLESAGSVTIKGMSNIESMNLMSTPYLFSDECLLPSEYHYMSKDQFLTSPLLSSPKFYHIDRRYGDSLVKPRYMNHKSSSKGTNEVELEYGFYHLYTSHLKEKPKSLRVPSTEIFEGIFDPRTNIRTNRVSRLVKIDEKVPIPANTTVQPNDLYLEELTGSRLRFELLRLGQVDYFNNVVTKEYIDQYNPVGDTVFRILKINGVDVGHGEKIWLNGFDRDENAPELLPTLNGRLMIDNSTVENLLLWTGV